MDALFVDLLVLVVLCLGGVLYVGAVSLLRIRSRSERLQMKRHLQSIEEAGWDEAASPHVTQQMASDLSAFRPRQRPF